MRFDCFGCVYSFHLFPAWQHYSRADITVLKVILTPAITCHGSSSCQLFMIRDWPASIVVGNRRAATFRGRRRPAWPEGPLLTHARHSLGMSVPRTSRPDRGNCFVDIKEKTSKPSLSAWGFQFVDSLVVLLFPEAGSCIEKAIH